MTTATFTTDEDGLLICDRCGEADVERYTLHATQRTFCHACGHLHTERARRSELQLRRAYDPHAEDGAGRFQARDTSHPRWP